MLCLLAKVSALSKHVLLFRVACIFTFTQIDEERTIIYFTGPAEAARAGQAGVRVACYDLTLFVFLLYFLNVP